MHTNHVFAPVLRRHVQTSRGGSVAVPLQEVKDSCVGPNGERASVMTVDVTAGEEELARFARAADALHGGIDYAFLAAGAARAPSVHSSALRLTPHFTPPSYQYLT
jgi:NAD(P)-dependent dehydrogenase (short-subunit alcohol dehydrogenase family)